MAYARQRNTYTYRMYRYLSRRLKKFLWHNRTVVILLAPLILGMLAGIFIGVKATTYAQSVKINDYGRQVAYTAYTVRSGDTVWGIAGDLAALNPEYNDIRQYAYEIRKLNGLGEGELYVGQVILIPYYTGSDGFTDPVDIYSRYGIIK